MGEAYIAYFGAVTMVGSLVFAYGQGDLNMTLEAMLFFVGILLGHAFATWLIERI